MNELDYILRDIDLSLYSRDAMEPFGFRWKDVIKEELFIRHNPRIAKLNGRKHFFKPWVYEVLEKHLCSSGSRIIFSEEADYIYLLIESIIFSVERCFQYKIYDYCETRLREKSDERKFWYVCIKSVHQKVELSDRNAEKLVLGKIFFSTPPEKENDIWMKRMKNVLKDAEIDLSKTYNDKYLLESISLYIQMLMQEIEERFARPSYEMFKL